MDRQHYEEPNDPNLAKRWANLPQSGSEMLHRPAIIAALQARDTWRKV